ncbi:MAG: hypothetical protein LBC83_05765 [Oscillospiraceae bacterium]|jgi:hypothetical protein|nr:hypothetical protein [Oscillospiraceae bacterium]
MRRLRNPAILLLALLLTFLGSAAVCAVPVEPATVTITLSYQSGGGWVVAPQTFTVTADLSDTYGYTDEVAAGEVSLMDAIIAAEYSIWEDALTEDFAVSYGPYGAGVVKMLGDAGFNFGFLSNGIMTDSVNRETIHEGDRIEMFLYQDAYYMDAYAWFERDGARVDALNLAPGEAAVLTMRAAAGAGYFEAENVIETDILFVEAEGGAAWFGETYVTTDAEGVLTVSFDEAGVYILSAPTAELEMDFLPLVAPWLVVTVAEPAPAPVQEPAPTALQKWEALLPSWLSGIPALADWFEWVIVVLFFGWIWYLV